LDVYPEHGRKHRIRRHLAAIGHGLIGDERYGRAPVLRYFQERHGLDRPFLHCASIQLQHAGRSHELVSSLPGDLCAVLESLEQSSKSRDPLLAGAAHAEHPQSPPRPQDAPPHD
jgi:hypothetical protein